MEYRVIWDTSEYLGTIDAGFPSSLYIAASSTNPKVKLSFRLVAGSLPVGMTLLSSGEIVGSPAQVLDGSIDYQFTVNAANRTNSITSNKVFQLTVTVPFNKRFVNVVARPLLGNKQRLKFADFISNDSIFTPALIYRPSDANFGVQRQAELLVAAGIEHAPIDTYTQALNQYAKRKRFTLGALKSAVAVHPGTREELYQVVYLEVTDPLEPNSSRLPFTIEYNASTAASQIHTVSSLSIWRDRLTSIENLSHERNYLPLWMRSIQPDSVVELEYVPAVVLCYCKPKGAAEIIANIKRSGFDFSSIDYTIERLVVSSNDSSVTEAYIPFNNRDSNIT